MEEYKVVSLFGAGSCQFEGADSSAIRGLRAKVRKLHFKHFTATLTRMAAAAAAAWFALNIAAPGWSGVLLAASGLAGLHTLLFGVRGHAAISTFYRARLYWLKAPGIDQDLSPVFVHHASAEEVRRTG